jgi:peptidoglycan L-alanyl-D-glutamate endopeptidase CwlK
MTKFVLGDRSRARLSGVHPDLVRVVERAITLTTVDFTVIEGLRTKARQQELYDQGRKKPGKIVTWTMNSKHRVQPDGFGHAVDLGPWVNGVIAWGDLGAFDAVALAMHRAAALEGVAIRWGADWDKDGKPREKGETDSPHFELVAA